MILGLHKLEVEGYGIPYPASLLVMLTFLVVLGLNNLKSCPSPLDLLLTFGGFHESEVKRIFQLSYRQYALYIFLCVRMKLKNISILIQTAYHSALSIISA